MRIELGLQTDVDPADLDAATVQLRNELLELDVDGVERSAAGEPPSGARAAEVLALGSLVVALVRDPDTIVAVVRSLQLWLARDRNRSVKLELDGDTLEVTGVSSSEQERLIAAWIEHHGGA
jgi:hypothetical protein